MARLAVVLVAVFLLPLACRDFTASAGDPVADVVPPPCASPAPLFGTPDPRVPGYIVVFHDSVDGGQETARLAAEYGFEPTHVYRFALQGFSAELQPSVVAEVRCEPTVTLVEHDQFVTIDG
jgi:peptidase inhibitor I9